MRAGQEGLSPPPSTFRFAYQSSHSELNTTFRQLPGRHCNINYPVQGIGICMPLLSTVNVGGSTTQTGIEIAFQHDLSAYEDVFGFASRFGLIGTPPVGRPAVRPHEYRAADGPRTVFTRLGHPIISRSLDETY